MAAEKPGKVRRIEVRKPTFDRPAEKKRLEFSDPRMTAARPAERSGLPIEKLEIPKDSKALIYLDYMEKNGDRAAGDLLKVLQNVDEKTAARLLSRDPRELLADYKRGLYLFSPDRSLDPERQSLLTRTPLTGLRARVIESDFDARFGDINLDEIKTRMNWLYDPKAVPLENLFRYVSLVDPLTELNNTLSMNRSLNEIVTRTGTLINIQEIFSLIDRATIGNARNAIAEMTAASPEKISPNLADEIIRSKKDSALEKEKCAVAAESLERAGDPGFESLVRAYMETEALIQADKGPANSVAGFVGGKKNHGANAVLGIIFGASLKMIEDPSTRVPRSLSLLEASGRAGGVSDPGGMMKAYRNVMGSGELEIKRIKDDVKQNEEAIRTQMPGAAGHLSAEAIYLTAMIKAVLTNRSYGLIAEKKFEDALDVLKKAEAFGTKMATVDIRYAMALTLYASGNKKEASDQLKLALSRDDDTLTGLSKILDRVPPTVGGNAWMDMADHFKNVEGAAEKIIEHYVLGYMINKHFGEDGVARLFVIILKNYPIWNALETYFRANDRRSFITTLDKIASQIKTLDRINMEDERPIQPFTRTVEEALRQMAANGQA